MLALLTFYEVQEEQQYLHAVERLGNWIITYTRDVRGAGGYFGGFLGWSDNLEPEKWKSTEHNLDLVVAFERLYQLTNYTKWHEASLHARRFVEAMWNNTMDSPVPRSDVNCDGIPVEWTQYRDGRFFWTGVARDGITVGKQTIPLDTQSWALQALGINKWTQQAVDYAERRYVTAYTLNE
ncbi:hypothetical protein KFU94_03835 [Chloroflexi bacterium TSY]|nr:hypothetical protein [Chloroflexi bacterium TSY]